MATTSTNRTDTDTDQGGRGRDEAMSRATPWRDAPHEHTSDQPSDVATVFGGGGLFGIAYNLGVAEAFEDAGVDLATARSLGTSAGSWAAAHLALGLRGLDTLDAVANQLPRIPDPRSTRLISIAREVFGADTRCPTVRVSAVRLPRLRRCVLSGRQHAIADLVAASSAVPGMLAPHSIEGVRYVDGGVRSMASADLGDGARRLLIVLPMSGPMFGPAGRLIERRTMREIAAWEADHPGSVATVVRPTRDIAKLVRSPNSLFDPERARTCYSLAYAQGAGLASTWTPATAQAA